MISETFRQQILLTNHHCGKSFKQLSDIAVQVLGLEAAYLFTSFVNLQSYCESKNLFVDDDGFFFFRKEDMMRVTTLKEDRLEKALQELFRRDLLEKRKISSTDRKTYYKVNNLNYHLLITSNTQKSQQSEVEY